VKTAATEERRGTRFPHFNFHQRRGNSFLSISRSLCPTPARLVRMGSASSAAPPFLAISSRSTLNSILSTLGEREQQRRFVGAQQAHSHSHRSNGRIGGRGGEDGLSPEVEGNDQTWYSTVVGTTNENRGKNRCVPLPILVSFVHH
jgi:hypothetical protein